MRAHGPMRFGRGMGLAAAVWGLAATTGGALGDVIVPVEQARCVRTWYSGSAYGDCEPDCDTWSGSCESDCALALNEVFSHAVGAPTCYGERATASQISSLRGDSVVVFGRAGGAFWSGMGCTGDVDTSSDFSATFDITREATVVLHADIGGDEDGVSSLMHLVDETSGTTLAELATSGASREQLDEAICLPIGRYRLVTEARGTPDFPRNGVADMTVSLGVCRADLDCSKTVSFGDVLRVLMAWGQCAECPEDVNQNGAVDFEDLLLVLSAWGPCTERPDWPGACHLEDGSCRGGLSEDECASLGGQFEPWAVCGFRSCHAEECSAHPSLIIEPYVGEGWFEHGFRSLTVYRIYAAFDEIGDDGVLSVFGDSGRPLSVESWDGKFHNAPEFIDSLTAPFDLRSAGIWENQWDTYVAINATEARGDATGLSSGFAEETGSLRRSFASESAGWFVTPDDEQSRSRGGRVFLGQFVVRKGFNEGQVNLLTRENEIIHIDFSCGGY